VKEIQYIARQKSERSSAILQLDLQPFSFQITGLPAGVRIFLSKPDAFLAWLGRENALASLPANELARSEKYRVEADRHAYIASHVLLRFTVAAVLAGSHSNSPSDGWSRSPKKLWTSISRRRGLVAVATSSEGAIGVDVEEISTPRDAAGLLEGFLDQQTMEHVVDGLGVADPLLFARCWTLIEAFTKSSGEGLVSGMPKLCIQETQAGAYCLRGGDLDRRAVCVAADERHMVAVAWADRSRGMP
jgi:4'-phosphopantetheinyl transferase